MTGTSPLERPPSPPTFIDKTIRFCLENKLVVALFMLFAIGWGLMSAPFDWDLGGLPRDPMPVDAIPDIGENQQIVFTEWMGRSPQDVEDQIGYPLTVSLLGIPGVKTIRSYSLFGFSLIYVIFDEEVEFYWSRSRVLEKLNSLPAGTLPNDVQPALGPDATALGQVYWYTSWHPSDLSNANCSSVSTPSATIESFSAFDRWMTASTTDRLRWLSVITFTNERSIFTISNGRSTSSDSDEYPVPKSSIATLTPALRNCPSTVIARSGDSITEDSVISNTRHPVGKSASFIFLTRSATRPGVRNCNGDTFTAIVTSFTPNPRQRVS